MIDTLEPNDESRKTRWLPKILFVLVGFLVGVLLTLGIILLLTGGRITQPDNKNENDISTSASLLPPEPVGPTLTFDNFLRGKYYPKPVNSSWISATQLMYQDTDGNIAGINVYTGARETIAKRSVDLVAAGDDFRMSSDGRIVMVSTNTVRHFRHSSVAHYTGFDHKDQRLFLISSDDTYSPLELVEWGPNGTQLVFAQKGNLYYQNEITQKPRKLTDNSLPHVLVGLCDWVYEEEVFASHKALWFSPDGKRMAYATFNTQNVTQIGLPRYGDFQQLVFQYPQRSTLAYPKAGQANPIVELKVVGLADGVETSANRVPKELAAEDHILSAVGWMDNATCVSMWMNRIQNKGYLQRCTAEDCRVFKMLESTDGWLNLFKELTFTADGGQLVMAKAQPVAGRPAIGAFRHVTLVATSDGRETQLTDGAFEVAEIVHYDAPTNRIFYMANVADRPEVLHLYAVKASAGAAVGTVRSDCLTCNITLNGRAQTVFQPVFNKFNNNVLLVISGPDVPQQVAYDWSLNATTDRVELKRLLVLEDNDSLKTTLAKLALPVVSYFDVPLDNGNFSARVRLQVPAGLNTTGGYKYPMLVQVYAGPDSYNGDDKFELSWGSMLVSQRNIVQVQINGRGSGMRGDRLRHSVYLRLGQAEVDDQIEVTQKLLKLLPYVDERHVAIWGWSYGGFVSAMALAKDANHVYKCAASVAPVTDFALYDSIYTERFMGLPSANPEGYFGTRVYNRFEGFRNRSFFLLHGTYDDNVHYQQSMALSRMLELNDIMFRQQSYPDEGHSMSYVQRHLYHSLGHFLEGCFRA